MMVGIVFVKIIRGFFALGGLIAAGTAVYSLLVGSTPDNLLEASAAIVAVAALGIGITTAIIFGFSAINERR
jgi:hypothetical protein